MSRQTLCLTTIVILGTASVSGAAIHAEDNFRMVGAKEIRAQVVGKDITDSSHWSMYLRPDGALLGEESGTRWSGTWKIQSNKLCLSNAGSKQLVCYEVRMAGEKINLRLNNDDDLDAVVAKHLSGGNR